MSNFQVQYFLACTNLITTRAKDVLPNIHCKQGRWNISPRQRRNCAVCHCVTSFSASEFLSLLTLTFDLWPWHSKSSERGTKHIFPVNLAQIRFSRSRDIWVRNKKQTNNEVKALKTEPYFRAIECIHASIYIHITQTNTHTIYLMLFLNVGDQWAMKCQMLCS